MSEYIDREALIENLNKYALEHYSVLINELICKQPAADVAPVVRCKDCERSYKVLGDLFCGNGFNRINIFSDVEVTPDFYCAEGKRKETTDG